MKIYLYIFLSLVFTILPLQAVESLEEPVENLVKKFPQKSLLIIYGANWSAMSLILLKRLKEDKEIVKLLSNKDLKIFYADCTDRESIGLKDMKRRGVMLYQ